MMHNAWRSKEEVPYCFSRSSNKFGPKSYGPNNRSFERNLSKITKLVAAIKSLRFIFSIWHFHGVAQGKKRNIQNSIWLMETLEIRIGHV